MKPFLPTALCLVSLSAAGYAASPASQAFDRMKTLVGTWSGGAGKARTEVTYKLTGGGSALVETLDPGSDHEMVTVYFLDGDRLTLTHYCAARNQPTMRLRPGKSPNDLAFEFVSGTNMKPSDVHMHRLKLKIDGANHLLADWTSFSDGRPYGTIHFDLRRAGR